jgi:fatty-acyl-CoA synthase
MSVHGLMMAYPLLVPSILKHAATYYGKTEIVSCLPGDAVHRYTYADAHLRARRLAGALGSMGVRQGDRVGTLAWSGYRHLELYYGVSGMGAVCHTINPRLSLDQIAYIINHADDRYVFFDADFAELVRTLRPLCPGVRDWIVLDPQAAAGAGAFTPYEDILGRGTCDDAWPRLDENDAAGLCYTSGTTGKPKGVLYTHRSTVLHALSMALPNALGISARDVVMPCTPMFHVMAWGLPYAAPAMGAKLVFPGNRLDGANLYRLCETEGVTASAGVPTVWLNLAGFLSGHGRRLQTLKRVVTGGTACPPALLATLQDEFGVQIIHTWGMSETSPLGTACHPRPGHADLAAQQRRALQLKQGVPAFGTEIKIVDADGAELPWNGTTPGDLLVRGAWVAREYFNGDGMSPLRDGWFATGDVATIDAEGYMQITDRSKDVIKSGGEWISSIELEKIAMAHPLVDEAAAIAVPHQKWGERPLLLVVAKPGTSMTAMDVLAFYQGRVPKWHIPDDVIVVDRLPYSSNGKLLKSGLRDAYRSHRWPDRQAV